VFKWLLLSFGFLGLVYGATPASIPKESCAVLAPCYNNHPYLVVDFLYWVAKQEGNNYAATGAAITVPGTVDPNTGLTPPDISSRGNVYAPNPGLYPGLKVGLGMNLEHGKWDLLAEYSYLYSKAVSSVYSNDLNAGILPIFSYTPNNSILSSTTYVASSGATGFVSGAKSKWTLQFNNINLELGKAVPFFCNLVLHPHFGLEVSWQQQHLNAEYFVSSTTAPSTSLGNNEVIFNQTFWGVGPRAGIDGEWQCCKHVGLFANSGFAALWGQFSGVSKSYDTNTTAGYAHQLIANQLYQPMTLSPVMQLSLGVHFDWMFCNCYRFAVDAAWETQTWFFQNQHSSSIADTDLVMQGLTLGARCDF
jgi:hypothetical protein